MYPIIALPPSFTFIPEDVKLPAGVVKLRPGNEVRISYPIGNSRANAIINLTYNLFWIKGEEKILIASAKSTYSIEKNDELELFAKSDTCYYCMKMLERNLQIYLDEKGANGPPKLKLLPITYQQYMGNPQNPLSISAN